MECTHEIYDDYELVGSGTVLEDGDISITIGDTFMGIYPSFDSWNLGKGYTIREIPRGDLGILEDQDRKINEQELYDYLGMGIPFDPSLVPTNPQIDSDDVPFTYNLDLDLDED